MLIVVMGTVAGAQGACHRGSASRAGAAGSPDGVGVGLANPREERPPPPLPPVLPIPEDVTGLGHPSPSSGPAGELRVRLEAEPAQLNPLLDADEEALMIVDGLVYEPLLECPSPGSAGGYRPRLAESWQVSADGLKVSLKLRPGIRWHDGHGVSVLDVQATLEPLLLPRGAGSPILKTSLQDVAGIEIAGASEGGVVRLSLKRPSDFVLRALCDIPILPEHLLRGGKGGAAALGRQPIGTGPFRFAGWERGKRLRLERWPSYWGEGARLESIVFEIDLDGASALTRMRRGDLDVLPRILAAHYPDQVDATSLRGGAVAVWRLASRRWVYLGVNHRHAPLGDAGLRQALAALWDREHLSQTLHGGMARPLAAPPIVEMAPPPSGRALAAARLEAAGYRDSDSDGVREFEGKPVRVSLLVASGGHAAATEARAFVLEARKVGVLVDTVPVDAATLMARVRKGDFDLAFMSWQGSPNEDPGLQFATTGPFNFWGYRSAPLDGLLDDLRRTSDTGARESLLGEVATLLARDQPVLFLYRLDVPVLISRGVHGIAAVADRWDLRHAWVDR